jgi:3-oxoacyl-[acyl-carrier protein] reductase
VIPQGSPGRLEDRVAVITGSSRGFGAEIARVFAREGARVVITYNRDQEGEAALAREVAAETGSELVLPFDVRDRDSVRDVMGATAERHGRIDVLVNNAGVNIVGDFDQITDEDWQTVIDTDLKGVFLCSQEALQHLSDGGRVINIGSVSGQYGGPRTPSYAAAKAGVMALTHCLARFAAPRGITVNCVSPGTIGSEMLDATMPEDLKAKILPNVLLQRLGTPREVADAVLFLAADDASYVTAQTISVNGGLWV